MNLAYWLDAWIYRKWYKKCIREICRIDSESESDRKIIKQKILELIEENGIPMASSEMEFFSAMEKSITWGFWYWVKRMEKRLVKKGVMNRDKFYKIAEDAFYPLMLKKIWRWRDSVLGEAAMGKRKKK